MSHMLPAMRRAWPARRKAESLLRYWQTSICRCWVGICHYLAGADEPTVAAATSPPQGFAELSPGAVRRWLCATSA